MYSQLQYGSPMNLKKLHKQKLEDAIFKCFEGAWSILIHDKVTSALIHPSFKKTDLLDFNITSVLSIGDERKAWDLPAIYFIEGSKEVVKTINSEFKANKYSSIKVFSLKDIKGLDPMIKHTVINLSINVKEERVFECGAENISAIAEILNAKLIVNYLASSRKIAEEIEKTLESPIGTSNEAFLFVLDRTVDLYTPLMYFFTFRTMVSEIGTVDCTDEYFDEIKNMHIGDVNEHLKYTVGKIQDSVNKLNKKNVDVATLDTLVLEAPKNIELKKSVEKYSGYLERCFQKLQGIKAIASAQQDLILEKDSEGNKVCISLDPFFTTIVSPGLSLSDRMALMFLLKTKGIKFTESEKSLLKAQGFTDQDINLVFNRKNQVLRNKEFKFKYDISRYEPVITNIVEGFIDGNGMFEGPKPERIGSLRKSSMITSKKHPKKVIVVYVKNGLSIEEYRIAYLLTERHGVEVFIGSDKLLNRAGFVDEYRENKDFHEVKFT